MIGIKSNWAKAGLEYTNSKNYKLMYYEIHLISRLDACDECPKVIYENINRIKTHFKNKNLFVFYHAQNHYETYNEYITTPYTLKFKIDKEKLSFFNSDLKWVTEPGVFEIMMGASSKDIRLKDNFELMD